VAELSRNKKCADVLQCAQDGLDEATIARKLNVGRGEVALILGLKDVYERV
jgi:hypothetical protein